MGELQPSDCERNTRRYTGLLVCLDDKNYVLKSLCFQSFHPQVCRSELTWYLRFGSKSFSKKIKNEGRKEVKEEGTKGEKKEWSG